MDEKPPSAAAKREQASRLESRVFFFFSPERDGCLEIASVRVQTSLHRGPPRGAATRLSKMLSRGVGCELTKTMEV